MYQQQEHRRPYTVPPSHEHEAWLWSLASQVAAAFLLAVVAVAIYIVGWNFTFDFFWNLGWYYFAFIPWTIMFLILVAVGTILLARYRIGSISYTVVEPQPPSNDVPTYVPPAYTPGENHPDLQPQGAYSDGLRAL